MKNALITLLIIFSWQFSSAQKSSSKNSEPMVGFGIGPENGMSLIMPKASYYSYQNRKHFETYYGVEGAAIIIETFIPSVDFVYGIKKEFVSLDCSVGFLWDSYSKYSHGTFNPKIGIRIKKIWLKAGPSYYLFRDNKENAVPLFDITKIKNTFYNFEILINVE